MPGAHGKDRYVSKATKTKVYSLTNVQTCDVAGDFVSPVHGIDTMMYLSSDVLRSGQPFAPRKTNTACNDYCFCP